MEKIKENKNKKLEVKIQPGRQGPEAKSPPTHRRFASKRPLPAVGLQLNATARVKQYVQ